MIAMYDTGPYSKCKLELNFIKVELLMHKNFHLCFYLFALTGRVQYFSMQVVMNKCFLNPAKNLMQICLVVFEKNAKNSPVIPKNNVPSRRLES